MKSFFNQIDMMRTNNPQGIPTTALVWKGLAPPRVEILAWFVLQGQLNTKKRLVGLNIIPSTLALCPLCLLANEYVEHLFFECMVSWKIWANYLLWWI